MFRAIIVDREATKYEAIIDGYSGFLFVDKNGNVYDMNRGNESSKAICAHRYVEGIVTKHIPDGQGGCTFKEYEAQVCELCHSVKNGNLISAHIYKNCPH